jgi:hypothetical protein
MKFLHEHGVVILSGREGTGKSKMCLEIASLCEEEDFMPYKVNGHAVVSSNHAHGEVYSIQLYVIKFVSDSSGILWVFWFPPPILLSGIKQ